MSQHFLLTAAARTVSLKQIQRMEELGVPTYAELVFVVRRRDLDEEFGARVRRFMQATARGQTRPPPPSCRTTRA